MKKFSKVFISLALVLILTIPMLAGCSLADLFGGNSQQNAEKDSISQKKRFEYNCY